MKVLFLFFSLTILTISIGQTSCDFQLRPDSITIQDSKTKELVKLIEVKIKNDYRIYFIKQDHKNYLKIVVRDNLGFGKKSSLLLLSNKKQIYIRSIELKSTDKTSAYFLISLNDSNYLETIKDNGLSSILFNETSEFVIPKSDSEQIKKAAGCFFEVVKDNLHPSMK